MGNHCNASCFEFLEFIGLLQLKAKPLLWHPKTSVRMFFPALLLTLCLTYHWHILNKLLIVIDFGPIMALFFKLLSNLIFTWMAKCCLTSPEFTIVKQCARFRNWHHVWGPDRISQEQHFGHRASDKKEVQELHWPYQLLQGIDFILINSVSLCILLKYECFYLHF